MLLFSRTVGSVYKKIFTSNRWFFEFHTGHDGPSEMIQYFVSKNKKDPYQRDILTQLMHSDSRTISSKKPQAEKIDFMKDIT